MLEIESSPSSYRERKERQRQIRLRKRREVRQWLCAVLLIGAGASAAVSMYLWSDGAADGAKIARVWLLGMILTFLAAAFGLSFALPRLSLLDVLSNTEAPLPPMNLVAYRIGIPFSILASGAAGVEFGIKGGIFAWGGGIVGFVLWLLLYPRAKTPNDNAQFDVGSN